MEAAFGSFDHWPLLFVQVVIQVVALEAGQAMDITGQVRQPEVCTCMEQHLNCNHSMACVI